MTRALPFAALLTAFAVTFAPATRADAPVIVAAEATPGADGWRFSVTVRHPDTGWDHYADGWAVIAPDGTELGYRTLLHPHVTEQPFTRSLQGVAIPEGVDRVTLRAHGSAHGWGPDFGLDLPR